MKFEDCNKKWNDSYFSVSISTELFLSDKLQIYKIKINLLIDHLTKPEYSIL